MRYVPQLQRIDCFQSHGTLLLAKRRKKHFLPQPPLGGRKMCLLSRIKTQQHSTTSSISLHPLSPLLHNNKKHSSLIVATFKWNCLGVFDLLSKSAALLCLPPSCQILRPVPFEFCPKPGIECFLNNQFE